MRRYAVLQPPMFQEDEGRYFLIGVYNSREEAQAAREKRAADSKGYFSPGSFTIFVQDDQ